MFTQKCLKKQQKLFLVIIWNQQWHKKKISMQLVSASYGLTNDYDY